MGCILRYAQQCRPNRLERRNLRRKWWSDDGVICADDAIQWCTVAESVTMTTGDTDVDLLPMVGCDEWVTTASKNAARRRRTWTRHFWVDRREFGFTISDVATASVRPPCWPEAAVSWRGWAIRPTKFGRRRAATPATRDGQRSSRMSRMMSESSLHTTHHHHYQQQQQQQQAWDNIQNCETRDIIRVSRVWLVLWLELVMVGVSISTGPSPTTAHVSYQPHQQ